MIQSKNNSEHYTWGNGCDSWVLNNSQNLSVKQEKMPAGTAEKMHFHARAEQVFYILKGEAVLYVNNEKFLVRTGESISIQPELEHFISNESQDDLEFLVISSPSTNNDRTEIEK
ncbi:cupin domain-containing protein [Chryseobacterium shigense]|uniref:Mannose-6-phosphate isomerase-like protein (Cupin superfamily) n=1 Tax=Chryseobacterium shigense TaxID=297244 RepID=A0A841NKY0_9FLAO|nr:cupin domain-containing protein [Chryseobacterium shigense]MBB6372722.1 mannose-6-phosphate isomerase-like protein (cupin superfamily) [Chryseobacterium shigense]